MDTINTIYYEALLQARFVVAGILNKRFKDNPPYMFTGFGAIATKNTPMICFAVWGLN